MSLPSNKVVKAYGKLTIATIVRLPRTHMLFWMGMAPFLCLLLSGSLPRVSTIINLFLLLGAGFWSRTLFHKARDLLAKEGPAYEAFLFEEIKKPRAGEYYQLCVRVMRGIRTLRYRNARRPLDAAQITLEAQKKKLAEQRSGLKKGRRHVQLGASLSSREDICAKKLTAITTALKKLTEHHTHSVEDLEGLIEQSTLLEAEGVIEGTENGSEPLLESFKKFEEAMNDIHAVIIQMDKLSLPIATEPEAVQLTEQSEAPKEK